MPTARQSAKSMFSIGLNIPPEAIAHVLMETRSHAALPPMTHQLRFQVWVKEITPLSSSTTSFSDKAELAKSACSKIAESEQREPGIEKPTQIEAK